MKTSYASFCHGGILAGKNVMLEETLDGFSEYDGRLVYDAGNGRQVLVTSPRSIERLIFDEVFSYY